MLGRFDEQKLAIRVRHAVVRIRETLRRATLFDAALAVTALERAAWSSSDVRGGDVWNLLGQVGE